MHTSEPLPYERGDSLEEVLDSSEVEEKKLYALSEDEYWAWLESLSQNGAELDNHLDDLLDEVYSRQPAFYDWTGRQALTSLLDELHDLRASVRSFEQDVEQIRVAFARTDAIETQAADNAEMILSQVKDTYNRAYDLCLYKLDRISNNWITATNLLISLTILVVTILFWMEFW